MVDLAGGHLGGQVGAGQVERLDPKRVVQRRGERWRHRAAREAFLDLLQRQREELPQLGADGARGVLLLPDCA